ncbi:MAG: hypothetical protein K6L76_05700 [Agarilytica sp.]
MQFLLVLSYPVLAHLGVVLAQPLLMPLAIVFLAAGVLFSGLKSGNWVTWLILFIVAVFASVMQWFHSAIFIMYIPLVFVPLLIGWGFARTLLPGQVPLVTEIGEKARGPLSESMRRYTRVVTQMWAVCLISMAVWGLLLAIFGHETVWVTFTGMLNYMIVGILFVGEFVYRKFRFKDHDHPKFHDYLKIVFRSQRGES